MVASVGPIPLAEGLNLDNNHIIQENQVLSLVVSSGLEYTVEDPKSQIEIC